MGDYRDKSGSERVDAPEKIDLTNIMLDVYHGVKRLWWLFIGLIIICAVQSYFSVSTSYQSKYVASATVSVTSVGGMDYVNAQSAQQMAEVFPYILTSGVLKDVVAEDMGLDSMPGSIDVKADDGTNLLTISVSGNDPQMAYKTLKSVIKNYPKVAEFVLGETKLTILEALVIAYGEGRNGKSTFWNTIARVLGTYSGNMSADTLTVGCKRNVKPELAEAKGKRMIIAAELEEGMRLNTSNVKQLCSTDEIYAEKKYKAPFSYVPTHTLVLYTNHLPRVGAIDQGTWRRLIVIPFNAKIEGKADIKNYADFLFKMAGGAVLQWIIEGAKRVIASDYKIAQPRVVQDAIQKYKENNDWLSHFLEDCCEIDPSYEAKSGEVYNTYRSYCNQMGEYARSTTDFYTAIEAADFTRHKTKKGMLIRGFRLKSEFE